MPLLYLNSHPSPLMCLGNSLSLEKQKKKVVTRTKYISEANMEFPPGQTQHFATLLGLYSLNELPSKGFELPGGCCCSQEQIQALSRQHVSQDPQKALGRLGVVCVYSLVKDTGSVTVTCAFHKTVYSSAEILGTTFLSPLS